MRSAFSALAAASLVVSAFAQNTWYVDVHAVPPGTGSQVSPYTNIEYALEQVSTSSGDTLLVAPGTYVENVDFGAKRVILKSTGGPQVTHIRAAGPGHVVTFSSAGGLVPNVIDGFTVSGGMGASDAGIFQPQGGSGTVRSVVVRDCVGIGVLNDYDLIVNWTTIFGNGVGLQNTDVGVLDVYGIIVWGNVVEAVIPPLFFQSIEYSIITNCGNCGPTTFYANPLFWDEAKSDVHLQAGSPAIQAGLDWGAFEFDANYAPPVDNVCSTSPNSVGPGALMDYSGSPSVSSADFKLLASGAPPGKFAMFYYGPESVQVPFGDGFRCVGSGAIGTFRLGGILIDGAGNAQTALDFTQPPVGGGPGTITPASSWTFQLFYRDPLGPGGSGFNLSDALRATFAP